MLVRKLGRHDLTMPSYPVDLCKEEVARQALWDYAKRTPKHPNDRHFSFLDVGCGQDERLRYLLGVRQNLDFDQAFYDQNRMQFFDHFSYQGLDSEPPKGPPDYLYADISAPDFLNKGPLYEREGGVFRETGARFSDRVPFDVIYSNNVFEHLRRPWIAAQNIYAMLRPSGICITIAPFSIRYHAVPDDFFRYSHTGIVSLFEDAGPIKVHISGYDITGRRNDWQGGGQAQDIVPIDEMGAWRENWFTITIIEKVTP